MVFLGDTDELRRFPTRVMIYLFLFVMYFVKINNMSRSVRRIFFGCFGGLTAYFELLHGALPWSVAVNVGVHAIQNISCVRVNTQLLIENVA